MCCDLLTYFLLRPVKASKLLLYQPCHSHYGIILTEIWESLGDFSGWVLQCSLEVKLVTSHLQMLHVTLQRELLILLQ